MPNPLVSVIIDNYNYARYLRQAIDSALAQTYSNFELIVVDDGSTDESRQIIRDYGDRITPLLKDNGGQGSAFNAGFALSRGELVCFLDSDDMWLPEKLAETVLLSQRHPEAQVLFHRFRKIDAQGVPFRERARPREIVCGDLRSRARRSGGCWPHPPTSALCFRRSFLERVMPAPEETLRSCADLYLATLAPFLGDIAGMRKPLTLYRVHGANAWLGSSRDLRGDLSRHEAHIHTINQTLQRLGIEDRVRLQDQLHYRLLRYHLGEGDSIARLFWHTLRWRGERPSVRMKMLFNNLRMRRVNNLPAQGNGRHGRHTHHLLAENRAINRSRL
jgi:glycosyltransferase involved in cell wall biosynthesis